MVVAFLPLLSRIESSCFWRALTWTSLREVRSEADVEDFLNAGLLRAAWASLTLPAHVRQFWETQHPALAA